MKTHKNCKGTGKAINYGCGELIPIHKFGVSNRQYGLGKSCGCFQSWVKQTPEGTEYVTKLAIGINKQSQKEIKKEDSDRLQGMKIEVYGKENKQALDREVQKLSRMIDAKLGFSTCIDCDIKFGNQIDGGHFHSKGSNSSIRWNLHNIHSQASHCNKNGIGGGKQLGYFEGLTKRYGPDYSEFVRFEIVRLYPRIGLTNKEVFEKLTLVRKLVRDFDTFQLRDGIQARKLLNKLIGIYNE